MTHKQLNPTTVQEVLTALDENSVPSLQWLEERLPGIGLELVEHILATHQKIKTILSETNTQI